MLKIRIIDFFGKVHPIYKLITYVSILTVLTYGVYFYNGTGILSSHDAAYEARAWIRQLHEAIANGLFLEYSFSIGIGSAYEPMYYSDPFKLILALFPDRYYSFVFLILEILKHYLVAIFFYLYLRKINIVPNAAIFGAIIYSFCGAMLIRSPWVHYTTEFVLIAFLLYSLEVYFQLKKPAYLMLALTMIFWHRGLYYVVMYSFWFFAYCICRCYIFREKYLHYLFKCLVLYLQSLLISSLFLLPVIYLTLHAGRSGSFLQSVSINIFGSPDMYAAVLFGLISENVTGFFNSSRFCPNGLDSPCFYISIFALLLVPIGIKCLQGRSKKVAIGFATLFMLYLFFPIVTFFYNLRISSEYYKLCIAPYVCGLIVLSCIGLESLKNIQINKIKCVSCFILVGAVYAILVVESKWNLRSQFLMLALFCYLISVVSILGNKCSLFIKLACLISVFELTFNAYETNVWMSQTANAFKNINEPTIENFSEVLSKVKEEDNLIRIDSYVSPQKYTMGAAPLYFSYNGTFYQSSYMDGDYINLLKTVGLKRKIMSRTDNRGWEVYRSPVMQKLLGVSFVVTADESLSPIYKIKTKGIDGKPNVWETESANDLITVYNTYITEEDFDKINGYENKQLALLKNIVIENPDFLLLDGLGLKRETSNINYSYKELNIKPNIALTSNYTANVSNMYIKSGNNIKIISNNYVDIIYPVRSNQILNYRIKTVVKGKRESNARLILVNNGRFESYKLNASEDGYWNTIQIQNKAIQYLIIRVNGADINEVNNIEIMNNRNIYDLDIVKKKNSKSIFKCRTFKNGQLFGILDSHFNGIALATIPYDRGWSIQLDGKTIDYFKVDNGLIGFIVPKGSHDVSMTYKLPGLRLGAAISFITLWLFLFKIFIRFRTRKICNYSELPMNLR